MINLIVLGVHYIASNLYSDINVKIGYDNMAHPVTNAKSSSVHSQSSFDFSIISKPDFPLSLLSLS